VRIPVEGDDAAAALDDRAGMAAGAERRVDVGAAGADVERGQRLDEKDGDVRRSSIIVNKDRAPW